MTKQRKKTKGAVNSGEAPTTASTIAFSGAFLRHAQEGKLNEFSRLREKFAGLDAEMQAIQKELTNCNDPRWLADFAKRALRSGRRFETALTRHAAQLERRKFVIAVKLGKIRRAIGKHESSLGIAVSATLATPTPFLTSSPAVRTQESGPNANPQVQVRDQTIRKYQALPNRRICVKLDTELMQRGAPPIGFPVKWKEKFGIDSFTSAYDDPKTRNLVQKLIWKAKVAV